MCNMLVIAKNDRPISAMLKVCLHEMTGETTLSLLE